MTRSSVELRIRLLSLLKLPEILKVTSVWITGHPLEVVEEVRQLVLNNDTAP